MNPSATLARSSQSDGANFEVRQRTKVFDVSVSPNEINDLILTRSESNPKNK